MNYFIRIKRRRLSKRKEECYEKQKIKMIMVVIIGCMRLAACGSREDETYEEEYTPTPVMFEENSGDV